MTINTPHFKPGDRVRFAEPVEEARYWWTVRAADERYAVLTRQAQFQPKGVPYYTIVDRELGVRGPSNLIGQGWNCESQEGCTALLTALRNGARGPDVETYEPVGGYPMRCEISHRNRIETVLRDHKPAKEEA